MQPPKATTSASPILTLGTRGSPLALAQAKMVRAQLAKAHDIAEVEIAICIINTDGDRTQTENLSLQDLGGKGLFSKEIETALLEGTIDIGVHSAKDMATTLPNGLTMPIYLPREDVRDAFISLIAPNLEALPAGARLGTSSLRRAAQLLKVRPDLKIIEFRGNVETRLNKLEDGIADATLLAVAGLNRLNKSAHVTDLLDPKAFPPAPAQGAIGLEMRAADTSTFELAKPLNHQPTSTAVTAERAFLRQLDGSCRTPIGALSNIEQGRYTLTGQILSPDGAKSFTEARSGPIDQAEQIGHDLGKSLVEQAGPDFMATLQQL